MTKYQRVHISYPNLYILIRW